MTHGTWKFLWSAVIVFPALILLMLLVQDSVILLAAVACLIMVAFGAVVYSAAVTLESQRTRQADEARLAELEPFPADGPQEPK